jgi:hypothetical protein
VTKEMLSYLLWEVHHYPLPPITIEIDHNKFRVQRGWKPPLSPDAAWAPMSMDRLERIEAVLAECNYWGWESAYNDPNICDGTTWEIKVRGGKSGKRAKNSEGINAFPLGWESVEAVLMELSDEYSENSSLQ